MKCFVAGRQSLQRTRACTGSYQYRSVPSISSYRQYVLIPTPRRMRAYDQSTPARDRDGSLLEAASVSQAQPLSGFYSLLLASPLPKRARTTTEKSSTAATKDQPTSAQAAASKPMTPQEKMAIVFGSPLTGPGRQSRYNPGEAPPESTWRTINGVPIPPRPEEPDNCCMSGCVHCVWDDFRDEIEEWAGRIAKAKAKGGLEKGTPDMRTEPRAEVDSASHSMDDDGGGSETNWAVPNQEDDLFASIPVGIREFMKTEKKLRVKHQKEASA